MKNTGVAPTALMRVTSDRAAGYITWSRDEATDGISLCSWSTTKPHGEAASLLAVASDVFASARVAPPSATLSVATGWPPACASWTKVPGRSLTYV